MDTNKDGSSMVASVLVSFMEKENVSMWGLLIAMLSGALMSIQGVFNSGAFGLRRPSCRLRHLRFVLSHGL